MNIRELRELLQLSQQGLADSTGIPKARIAKWEQGKGSPKANDFEILKKFFDEHIPQTSYREKRLALKNGETPNELAYYEVGANAGTAFSGEILPVKKSEGTLRVTDLFRNSQYAIRISGNSMMPNYPSGAIIGIREIHDKMITPGSVYVIEKENDLWIKRLFYADDNQSSGFFECVSDNDMVYKDGGRAGKLYYPPFRIEIDKVRRLFKVTGIYKANELTVIN